MGEHLHLPQPLHSPRIRTIRVWSAPRRLGASLVKRQSDLVPPIYLVSQIQWVGRAGQRVSQAWLEGSREGDIQEPQCDAVGRTRPQTVITHPTPSHWKMDLAALQVAISLWAPHQRDLHRQGKFSERFEGPQSHLTDLCNYLGAPPTDSHLPLCCLPLGCFSVRSPLKLPQLGVEPTAFLQSPLFFSGSPTSQKTQLSSSYAPGSLRPTVLSPCSSRWG